MGATMKDIARLTGLGLATISSYFNGGNVREKNRIKIEEAVKELNFEVNATIYSETTAKKLEEAFENDLMHCEEVTEETYEQRTLLIRMKEQVSRLFSPLL